MTTLAEYQQQTRAFVRYAPRLELHYAIPALRQEVDEWIDTPEKTDEEILEMGDCLFMLARIFDHFDIALDESAKAYPATVNHVRRTSGKMLDIWVKIVRDREGVVDEGKRGELLNCAYTLLSYMRTLAAARGMTLGELAETNVRKLTKRYQAHASVTEGAR